MAAGVGSRFGGPKQLEPVGPAGETLMDYLLVDARRAGFDRAVLVIRDELTTRVEAVAERHRSGLEVSLAYQQIGPDIPRGTVPAVLAAADRIDGPFVALNADDFYGTAAYQRAADFLRDASVPPIPTPSSRSRCGRRSRHAAPWCGACARPATVCWFVWRIRGIEPSGTGPPAAIGNSPATSGSR